MGFPGRIAGGRVEGGMFESLGGIAGGQTRGGIWGGYPRGDALGDKSERSILGVAGEIWVGCHCLPVLVQQRFVV